MEKKIPHIGAGWNRKTGTGQGLTWLSARFMLGGYSIVYLGRVTSMYVCSGDSSRNYLVQETDTHGKCGDVSAGWCAVGERLQLEKNRYRTPAGMGGGMVDEKIGFITTPYSVVWVWGNRTREARREPGFLGRRT